MEASVARRWDPLQDLFQVGSEVSRLLGTAESAMKGAWAPAADILETPDKFQIVVELPGIDVADVARRGQRVALRGRVLRLRQRLLLRRLQQVPAPVDGALERGLPRRGPAPVAAQQLEAPRQPLDVGVVRGDVLQAALGADLCR